MVGQHFLYSINRDETTIKSFVETIKTMDLIYNASPNHDQQQYIDDKLFDFNRALIEGYHYEYFTYMIVDDSKKTVAGINCQVGGGWLYIVGLWVDENYRDLGIGEKLLKVSEEKAKEKGCHGAYLFSYSFQAPGFYKKYGYGVFGELEDFCFNHSKVFMKKRF